jgi:hypothetical protein
MRSFEPGENWGWCFIDEVDLDFTLIPTGA